MYSTVAMTGFLYTRSAKQWVERWFWNPKGLWNDGEAGFQLQPEKIAPKFACQKTMAFVVRLIYVMFCALKLCSEKQNDLKHQNPSHLFLLNAKKNGGKLLYPWYHLKSIGFPIKGILFPVLRIGTLMEKQLHHPERRAKSDPTRGKNQWFFFGGVKKNWENVGLGWNNPRWNLLDMSFGIFFRE